MMRSVSPLAAAVLLLALPVLTRAAELGRISGMEGRDLATVAFELQAAGPVDVEATVLRGTQVDSSSRVWLLDADRRELVWEPTDVETVERSRFVQRWRQRVNLDAGRYELYFAAWSGDGPPPEEDDSLFESLVREVVGIGVPPDVVKQLGVVASGAGTPVRLSPAASGEPGGEVLIALGGLGDDQLVEQGFALARPATVEVYAVGELSDDERYDWGWLVKDDSRQAVWEMSWDGSQPAGGWRGNRRVRTRLELPPGLYAAGFQSDRRHSLDGWSGPPPYDPSGWGLQVRCVAGPGCESAQPMASERLPAALEIARLTGLGDDERRELPFRLQEVARLRVYVVGEGSRNRLWDHGWIERAGDGERVWQVDVDAARPAGGAGKNLRVDETIELAAGDYVAVYETDDSHSVGDGWNAAALLEPDRWGMTLLAPRSGLVPD